MIKLFDAKYILLSGFLCFGSLVHAQDQDSDPAPDRWFEVELIVFQHTTSPTDERWTEERETDQSTIEKNQNFTDDFDFSGDKQPSNTETSQTNKQSPASEKPLVDLKNADGTLLFDTAEPLSESLQGDDNEAWVILPTELHQLTAEATHLKVSKEYNVLFHQAWRQPMVFADQSSWVVISGGERFNDQYSLQGSIRYSLRRYLHARTDLALVEFAPIQSKQNIQIDPEGTPSTLPTDNELSTNTRYQAFRTFRLQQGRRMRSGELHYIDSPVLGVLIKITPYHNESEIIEVIEEPEIPANLTQPDTANGSPVTN